MCWKPKLHQRFKMIIKIFSAAVGVVFIITCFSDTSFERSNDKSRLFGLSVNNNEAVPTDEQELLPPIARPYSTASPNSTPSLPPAECPRAPGLGGANLSMAELSKWPLVNMDDLVYQGAFRVPNGKIGASEFAYGGTAPAHNPKNDSLFIVGNTAQAIAEISIPEVKRGEKIESLAIATILQAFVDIEPRIPNYTLEPLGGLSGRIGGLLVIGEQLIGSIYEFYDGDHSATDSHFKLSTLDLATSPINGLFQVSDQFGSGGGGMVGGYMTPVPSQWQTLIGAPFLTGQAALSIIGRTSAGPAAFGFDTNDFGSSPASAVPLVYYTVNNPLAPLTQDGPLFNRTSQITGVVFVPYSRSVLFIGSHGTGEYCYGEGTTDPLLHGKLVNGGPAIFCYDLTSSYKGEHSTSFESQIWAYDVLDMLLVKNGTLQPWEIRPYGVWPFDLPFEVPNRHPSIGGAGFDPKSGRIFISQTQHDLVGCCDLNPIIHVMKVRNCQ